MFYHRKKVILIRWQANYVSSNNNNPNSKKNEEESVAKKFSFAPKTVALKAAVILTIFDCDIKSSTFFGK